MGIPEGITLIVGGGFHGKSTLLQALQVRQKSPMLPIFEPSVPHKRALHTVALQVRQKGPSSPAKEPYSTRKET